MVSIRWYLGYLKRLLGGAGRLLCSRKTVRLWSATAEAARDGNLRILFEQLSTAQKPDVFIYIYACTYMLTYVHIRVHTYAGVSMNWGGPVLGIFT